MVETKTEREWTIEQETVLFKAICRYKPAGQHKHFRMLCIYQMVNNSNIQSSSPLTMHDIWNKLSTLYNLEGLDELEDSSSFMAEEENAKEPLYFGSLGGSLAKDGTYLRDFGLPWGEFGSLIEEKAVAGDSRESSPGYESDKSGDVPESQANSDESDAENAADADKGSEAESARNTPMESVKQSTNKRARTPVRKAAATATARTTRSTRQRTAAKKRKEASPTPEVTEESKGDNADEAKEEDTEQSEKEESPLSETTTTARNKRTRTQSKPATKAKPTPSRRSNRRK